MQIKKTRLFIIILLLLNTGWAFCQNDSDNPFRFVYSHLNPNVENINAAISDLKVINKLENIHFENMEQLISIHKLYMSYVGDDVGNGGDSIRELFIRTGKKLIEQLNEELDRFSDDKLLAVLDIKQIKIIKNLESCSPMLCLKTSFAVADNMIYLNKDDWDIASGFIHTRIDRRNLMIYLIVKAAGYSFTMDEANALYSKLSTESSNQKFLPPFCDQRIITYTVEKIPHTTSLYKHKIDKVAKEMALTECRENGLQDCYTNSKYGGFAVWTNYQATATGYQYLFTAKNKKELKKDRCQKLKACELVYEIAPWGQVSLEDFQKLDQMIESQCF